MTNAVSHWYFVDYMLSFRNPALKSGMKIGFTDRKLPPFCAPTLILKWKQYLLDLYECQTHEQWQHALFLKPGLRINQIIIMALKI